MPTDRSVLAQFLRARRELLQPEEVGIERDARRKVVGLRREEVARLAGISAEYYLRLEQGRDHQPSEQVLLALSRALLLDEDERTYLHRLAHPPKELRRDTPATVDPAVLELLDRWSHVPAYIVDRNQDVLAANPLAAALAPDYLVPGSNLLIPVFEQEPEAHEHDAWEVTARRLIAALRFGSAPSDPRLQELVGTLSMRSRSFRRLWALHDAKPQTTGIGLHHIPPHGWVHLRWQSFTVPGEARHTLTTFFGDRGSDGDTALTALAERIALSAEHDLRGNTEH